MPANEPFGITLAKAHLESELTDYVIIGINAFDKNLDLKYYDRTTHPRILEILYEKLLEKLQDSINQSQKPE